MIKLDRSIVARVSADPVLHTLVRSIVVGRVGHSSIVAVGIEIAQDAEVWAQLGGDYGQGRHFG